MVERATVDESRHLVPRQQSTAPQDMFSEIGHLSVNTKGVQ